MKTSTNKKPWINSYVSPTKNEIEPIKETHIPQLLRQTAQKFAERIAFTTCLPNGMNGSLSFKEVDQLSDAFAFYLKENLKLEAGARVAIQMPNCLAYPIVAFGVLKAGCVLVNTNPLYTPSEMKHQFKDAGVSVLVLINMFADKIPQIQSEVKLEHIILARLSHAFPPVVGAVVNFIQKYWNKVIPAPNFEHSQLSEALKWGKDFSRNSDSQKKLLSYLDGVNQQSVAVLQYTGGTTGVAKGAMLSHGNLLANRYQVLEMLQNQVEEGRECILTALPLYHIFAFSVNLLVFYTVGGRNILIPSPRPLSNLKRSIENYPLTWLTGVNTLFNGLCHEIWFSDSPPRKLKATIAGGMALQSAVAEKWNQLCGAEIVEGYGLSETSPVLCFNPMGGKIKAQSIGIPLPSTDLRLIGSDGSPSRSGEPGEIEAKGPQIMRGYWNRPDEDKTAFSEDGYFRTGDIAVMNEEGYFSIVDRKKDMILVSGFNVYPNEIEDQLVKHPEVVEAAVIGVEDPKSGEAVKAFVVLKEGSELSVQALNAFCREHLAAYKVPKSIVPRESLPKNPIGKILRKDLRKEEVSRG